MPALGPCYLTAIVVSRGRNRALAAIQDSGPMREAAKAKEETRGCGCDALRHRQPEAGPEEAGAGAVTAVTRPKPASVR